MAGDEGKRAALIAEGATEGEADYLMSGGKNTDGLTPPADASADASAAASVEPAKEPAKTADATAAAKPGEAAAPAAGADDDDGPEPTDPNATIPYQKYSRDKKRLQDQLRQRDERLTQTSGELNELQQKWARLDERMNVFREAVEAPAGDAAKPKEKPDRETDPFGYMAWLEERVESLAPQVQQLATQTQERDAAVVLKDTFTNDARVYAQTNPDFWEDQPGARNGAYHFLMKSRDAELKAAGYTDPVERLRIISLDERDIVARALHARQQNPQAPGPAQVLYNLATARGYQKRTAPANGAGGTNGAAPANGAAKGSGNGAAAAAETVTTQVENIARGAAASRSLSSAGGAPAQQGLDLTKLAEMDDTEYLAWKASLSPQQQKDLRMALGATK